MTRDKWIDKIAKLMKKQESAEALGNAEEAQIFGAKVTELLLKHQIDMSEVEVTEYEEAEPVEQGKPVIVDEYKKQRNFFEEGLARRIAKHNMCRILIRPGTNMIYFVGRKTNREQAQYLFVTMARQVQEFAQKEYDREYYKHYKRGEQHLMKGWKRSFLEGFLVEFGQRLREMRQAVEDEVGENKFALIKVQDKAVTEWIKENTRRGGASALGGSQFNSGGYRQGKKHARNVDIQQGVGGGSDSQKKIK